VKVLFIYFSACAGQPVPSRLWPAWIASYADRNLQASMLNMLTHLAYFFDIPTSWLVGPNQHCHRAINLIARYCEKKLK